MRIKLLLTALCLIGFSDGAFAGNNGKSPCKGVIQACHRAGYIKNGHKNGKGLYLDCVNPIINGGSVPGVTVDQNEVQMCKKQRGSH